MTEVACVKKFINATHLGLFFDPSISSNILSFLASRGVSMKMLSVNRFLSNKHYSAPIRHVELHESIIELEKAIIQSRSKGLNKSVFVWSERLKLLKKLDELNTLHNGKIPNTTDEYDDLHIKTFPLVVAEDKAKKEKELQLKKQRQREFVEKWNQNKKSIFIDPR